MKVRRKSREMALQALFYMDMRQNISLEAFDLYCQCFPPPEKAYDFFAHLTRGVMQNRSQLDRVIERFASNWKISRMACADRNILRLAVYEILFCDDIPPKVSINEAIEIGKKFGTEESGSFINGILDGIHIALQKKEIRPDPGAVDEVPRHAPPEPPPSSAEDADTDVRFSRVSGRPGVVRRRGTPSPSPPDTTKNE